MPLKIVRPKGRRFWYLSGQIAGERIFESCKTTDRALADALRKRRENEIDRRRILGPAAVATFAEAVNLYLDNGGEGRFLAPLVKIFGREPLAGLDQRSLNAAAREHFSHLKPSSLNRQVYTPFIAIMREAQVNRLAEPHDWRRPRGHDAPTRFRWFWPAEAERIIAASAPHYAPLVAFFLGTGARTGEGLALDWHEVDLTGGGATLWGDITKSGESRQVELPPRTVAALAALPHREGPVFLRPQSQHKGAPMVPYVLAERDGGGTLKTAHRGALRRAGIGEKVIDPTSGKTTLTVAGGPHDFRHSWATWFYAATLDRQRLKSLGGWASDQVDRYCHLAPRSLADELIKYGWMFDRDRISALSRRA